MAVSLAPSVDDPPFGTRLIGLSLLVVAVYGAVGSVTLMVGQLTGLASPVWPAAGIAFAVAYEWGWRMTPAIMLGSLLSNAVTFVRQDALTLTALVVSVVIAVGAALQAQVGATLVAQAIGRRAPLISGGEIIAFLVLSGPLAATVNATVATVAQVASGLISTDQWILLWVTWWAGDAVGVVIFGPLTLMCLPGQRSVWDGRRWKVAIPAVAGTVLFIGFFAQSEIQSARSRQLQMQLLADEAAGDLERNVTRHQEVLEGVVSLYHANVGVRPDQFATFTEGALERFPSLQAISWNPIVAHGDVDEFEAAQRVRGFNDFEVTQRDAGGELVPASGPGDHVVVGYIEPLAENAAALGFDINSNPLRAEAIERALATQKAVATAPIDLVQDSGTQKGMLALVPIFDDDDEVVQGFAVGVYRLADLLNESFNSVRWDNLDIRLVDVTDADSPEEVVLRGSVSPASIDLTSSEALEASSEPFDVYGRSWQIVVAPTSGPLTSRDTFLAPGLDLVGLILLTLLQAFVLLVTGTERRARRRADDFGRMASTDELTGVGNRRAFLTSLESVRRRSIEDGSAGMLLFIDIDRFKAINDIGGHDAGDAMLKLIAGALAANVRSRDIVTRIGGDEFAVILNDCPVDLGRQIAETLVERVEELRLDSPQGPLGVGASIGVMPIAGPDDRKVDELIRLADDACYRAKHAGGGVVVAV